MKKLSNNILFGLGIGSVMVAVLTQNFLFYSLAAVLIMIALITYPTNKQGETEK